jgi:hypothetical protein
MHPRIVAVGALKPYVVELTFTDGSTGRVDLASWIVGGAGLVEELNDPGFFVRVRVDPEAGTIVWPNGVDVCPDLLYEETHRAGRVG